MRQRSCSRGCLGLDISLYKLAVWDAHLLAQFFGCSVVYGSADLVPPHVGVGQEALVHRGSSRQGEQDRGQRAQLIVHATSLGDILSLERDLQTAAAHSKSHGIHMNKVIRRGAVANIVVFGPVVQVVVDGRVLPRPGRVHVFVDGHVDLHFSAAAGADVGGEGWESDVWVRYLVGHELGAKLLPGWWEVGVCEYAW